MAEPARTREHQGEDHAPPGATVYSRTFLAFYDLLVLRVSTNLVWRCPTRRIVEMYDRHVSSRHLEVGPGSGYFLDRCRVSTPFALTLLDANANVLEHASSRLRRYAPETVRADVLEPLPMQEQSYDSIGMQFVLHCLPGTLLDKASAVDHLLPFLDPKGTLFGGTLLADVPHPAAARGLMALYNRTGVFSNRHDRLADLHRILEARFDRVSIEVVGSNALFVASEPRPPGPSLQADGQR